MTPVGYMTESVVEDPRIGKALGGYVVTGMVADGAMGRVYEAREPEGEKRVAIKVLHSNVATDPVAVERFNREYETAQELSHPHVVKVLDYGETGDGSWFMIMEYLEGEELGQLLRREGAQEMARVVRITAQIALALEHAHSYGVVHRDLKPDNIFLCRGDNGDTVRILDFGSVKLQMDTGAKLTAFGTTLGSPYYMSPEQAMGRSDVDQRSDVFALCAILFEMLTGIVAFDAPNVAQILMQIVSDDRPVPSVVAPGLPASVDDVVDKGLRQDKDRRFASARDVSDALVSALGLDGDTDHWALQPLPHVQQAVAQATPLAPKAFGEKSLLPAKKKKKGFGKLFS